jgi:uncharacterized membrane protein
MSSPGPVLLDTTLRPSPPLPPRALLTVLGIVVFINLMFAAWFLSRGAWPVMPFLGADIVLLAWAFRASTMAARRVERVTITPAELHLSRIPPKGPVTELSWNPYWVRVELDEPAEPWSQITLWSRGHGVRIGTFLPPTERVGVAAALKDALRHAREYRWA